MVDRIQTETEREKQITATVAGPQIGIIASAIKRRTFEATREATQEYRLFGTEDDAYKYLDENVPPPEEDIDVDFSPLYEPLFDAPDLDEIKPGHYEFEGKNGVKISYDVDTQYQSAAMEMTRIYSGVDDSDHIEGLYRPAYRIRNLTMSTPHFSYSLGSHSRPIEINWMPNLRSKDRKYSHANVHIDKGKVYIIGHSGLLATPKDILTLFHELGHIETRTPQQMVGERNSVNKTYSSKGFETEPYKESALELQREIHANGWMVEKMKPLFSDLNLPQELLDDHVQHGQLRTYHEVNRDWLGKNSKQQEV